MGRRTGCRGAWARQPGSNRGVQQGRPAPPGAIGARVETLPPDVGWLPPPLMKADRNDMRLAYDHHVYGVEKARLTIERAPVGGSGGR